MDQYTKIALEQSRWTGTDNKTGQPIYKLEYEGIEYEANNTYDLITMIRQAKGVDTVEHIEVIREEHGKPASA